MDISADVAAIVEQASEWNFAGDCALLELMKRISQNLHERGEQTSRNLREFETQVRRVDIALDNATNSLRSLQFGQQFVEYRVEEVDDDDFVLPEEQQKKPELPLKSSQELAAEFLQNNLQMFRKNFEAVTIELTDSDEEDGTVNATTVYRAKNPYDSIPLPYVIGSKEWQEHKYAGLYDSAENSEDEQPEQFSSSSSDELETAAPKPTHVHQAQHSDSSSLASLPKENQATPAAQPVPQLVAQPVPQPVLPVAQPRPIISMHRNPHESDMFAALRASPPSDDPPSSSASSLNSSPAISHANAAATGLSSSSSSTSKVVIQAGRQSPPKLFDEAVPVAPAATPIDVPSDVKPTPTAASQIKRKPVNLFNDEEFNSFMSEIVDKVQSKSGNGSTTPATVAKSKSVPKESPAPQEVKPVAPPRKATETPQRSLNLFEDSPPLSPNLRPATSTANPAKKLPTSLFDDNLDDDVDDFLSSFTAKPKPQQQKPKTTLFDDDDDLDIDDIFGKKTPTVQPTKIVSTRSLFDDDVEDVKNAHDIFGTSSRKSAEKQPQPSEVAPVLPPAKEPPIRSLFDDLGDDDLFGTPKTKKPSPYAAAEKEQLSETKRLVEEAPAGDVVSADQVMEQQLPEQAEPIGDQAKKLERQIPQASQDSPDEAPANLKAELPISKVDLFSEDFSDEEAVISSTSHASRDLKEIATSGDLLPEPTNKAKEDQDEPEQKDKVELVSNNEEQHEVKPALLGDLLNNINDSSANTIAEEEEQEEQPPADQDPIISLVAEQSKKSTHSPAPADVAAAQQIMQNYSSLFSDEPPDDSEFFQSLGTSSLSSLSATKMFDSEQDFYEPSLPDLPPAAAATVEQPNNDYGGMRLFSDEPPDDDEDEEDEREIAAAAAKQPDVAAPKRIHTIFYDDFSETTRAGAAQQAKSAIFAEEPPPADAVAPKPSSPIKKLQMPNININVQALLPGSGAGALPKPPKKLEEAVAPSAAPISQVAISSSSEADNILQCISKTRVRGPAHRRPSTRRARQANYAKSLLEAQPEPTPASSTSPSAATSTTASLSSKSAGVPSFESDDNEADDALFKAFRAQPAAAQESSRAAISKPSLFLDCEADEDELFGKTLERKADKMPAAAPPVAPPATAPVALPAAAPSVAPPAISPAAPPATAPVAMLSSTQPPEDDLKLFAKSAPFLDSDEDDDGFLFSPSAPQRPAQYANRGTSKAPTGPPKSYVSFLDNNDEDEDAMFAAAATGSAAAAAAAAPTALPSQKPPKDKLKSTAKSAFLDSEDDDDEALFQPSKLKTQPQLVEPKSSKVQAPAPAPASVALDKSKPQPVKSKLFDDSDDDNDDLFGSAVSKAQSAPAAAATLFASSSEEEPEQKPPKPLTTKAKLPAKSLFSDDDDDDDLFGGGAAAGAKRAAVRSQAKPLPKKASSKTTTATPLQASKTDGVDNPLADLLGP
ncbi:WASH complex subunit 2 [Drosophila novamexicana]|uniref:WASH complex subunit 2 n=1 Tax=Drosophila novamexicana TaxID=47314 RepID=UPI0011E5DEC5|nr:WASH complex subunit 2 [Drosophila novamexicana]